MKQYGYRPVLGTTGMWEHETRCTKFCFCVDDFVIKYFSKEEAQHLLDFLGKHYKYTTDWKGKNYCGLLTMDWHYNKGYVDVSMPGYIPLCLQRLQHVPKNSPSIPHTHTYQSSTEPRAVDNMQMHRTTHHFFHQKKLNISNQSQDLFILRTRD